MVDTVQVWVESDIKWVITVAPYERSVGSSTGENTIKDSVFDTSTDATTFTEAIVDAMQDEGEQIAPFIYTSFDTDIATVDQSGTVMWVKNGTARISVEGPRAIRQNFVPVLSVGGQTTEIFNRFVAGSLAKHSNDFIMAGISGKTPDAASLQIFSTYSPGTDIFVRSSTSWFNGCDLTALVAYTPTHGVKPGQMFTDKLGINVAHYAYL